MMNKMAKIKLKGNESFNFREGWLRKGVRCVEIHPDLFSRKDVIELLGVGSKMVKSIRFWLLSTGLCEEKIERNIRRMYLTENFGKIVNKHDPYFDDLTTLYFIHFYIVKNEGLCPVWNIFYNQYSGQNFSKADMIESCKEYMNRHMDEGASYSESLFEDDCVSVFKMYLPSSGSEDPEESLGCPLSELDLLQKSIEKKNTFVKMAPARDNLDLLAVFYVIMMNIESGKNAISINSLLNGENNIGRVFNLSRFLLNEYLDQLRAAGYITINRTAGLDMIYIVKSLQPKEILEMYYTRV